MHRISRHHHCGSLEPVRGLTMQAICNPRAKACSHFGFRGLGVQGLGFQGNRYATVPKHNDIQYRRGIGRCCHNISDKELAGAWGTTLKPK